MSTAGPEPPPTPTPEPPVSQTREFWVLMGYALVLGVLGAFAGLVFMGVVGVGDNWYSDSDPGWLGGHWSWVAVTAATGVIVGVLRRLTRLPDKTPGLIDDLKDEHVDPRLVPGIAVVSAVSLIGGASLGPEKALGSIGGGAGSWLAARRRLNTEDSQVNTLSGFAGAYGGLFSSPVIVVMMIMELARPGGRRFSMALVGAILSASVSFGIYFAIAGAVFGHRPPASRRRPDHFRGRPPRWVHRSFLHRHPDLATAIHAAETPGTAIKKDSAYGVSLQTELANVHAAYRRLAAHTRLLETRLSELLGQEAARTGGLLEPVDTDTTHCPNEFTSSNRPSRTSDSNWPNAPRTSTPPAPPTGLSWPPTTTDQPELVHDTLPHTSLVASLQLRPPTIAKQPAAPRQN